MMRWLALGIASITLTACAPEDPAPDADPGATEANVEDARAALQRADSMYAAAAIGKDVDAVTTLYADDAVMYPPGARPVRGLDGVRAFADEFTSVPGMTMTFRPAEVVVSRSGDVGYVTNIVQVTMPGAAGDTVRETLRDVHVWRRQPDGSWKVVIDIWNAEGAPQGSS